MAIPVPELRKIAAANVAVSIWNHIDKLPCAAWNEIEDDNFENVVTIVKLTARYCLPLPDFMIKLIVEYTEKVQCEMMKWASYHRQKVFFKIRDRFLFCHLRHFVWYPDCTIDYKQTAQKLQNSLRLNEIEKFRLLCLYCLEDEIRQKWKLLYENGIQISFNFEANPLMYYWDCYCRDDLHKVPVENLPINDFMFQHDDVDNWPAKEYFFDRMSVHGQVRGAVYAIDRWGLTYQKSIIMKLSKFQRSELFKYRAMQLLMNFIRSPANSADILPVWREMSEIITNKDFEQILNALFQDTEIDRKILAEIWDTASDTLKLHVLREKQQEFIRWIWDPWTKFYEYDSFKMFLGTSDDVRQEITTMPMFNDHCLYLLSIDKLPMLIRMLHLCFPGVDELASIKRILSQSELFGTYCENLIITDELTKLDDLLNFFCSISSAEESIQFKKDLTTKQFFGFYCHELLAQNNLLKMKTLVQSFIPCYEESTRYRQNLINVFDNYCQNIITEDILTLPKLDRLLEFHFSNDSERAQFKKDFSTKKFFEDHCEKLIINRELTKLEILMKWFYPCVEEFVQFRKYFIRKKFVDDIFQRLIINDEYSWLKLLFNSFLFIDDEDLTLFKLDFANKEFFINFCLDSIIRNRIPTFLALVNLFFPYIDELIAFKTVLLGDERFYDYCLSLIKDNQVSTLDFLFDSCFLDVKEIKPFKKKLVKDTTFSEHCQELIDSKKLTALEELLVWSFPDHLKLSQYKRELAYSKNVKERCLIFYAIIDEVNLSDLLTFLFLPCYKLIYEYQRNLLLSERGIELIFRHSVHRSKTLFDSMIMMWFPSTVNFVDFKREMIFSPPSISLLKKMLRNDPAHVIKCFDWFLESDKEKDLLKMQLLQPPDAQVREFFFKSDLFMSLTMMKWWLPDKTAIKKCKCEVLVDEIFEAGLKECVFQSFNSCDRVSRCILRKDFNFEPLERFLNWYFECPKKVKEYKILKVNDYDIETISVLLEKGCKCSGFNKLLSWFFENDDAEMANFKKKHEGEKIANIMSRYRSRRLFFTSTVDVS